MNRILSPADKAAKQERRAIEGKANMARYLEHQQATMDKTARLRARRLARADVGKPKKLSPKAKAKDESTRRTLPGLHQGVRE